ncbi:hypothetical protein KL86PLE_20127 [uncultured Pleomorphomonas sp.]|uniref:Uncharacterized protein n=1 Tax=uncultured Pleomorphomonas sp. TaxID=442121 RepID=A0A212LDN2_9HYPH|nr:hypothetical protein KL86PLE_20127 [uncultured Pleomorphomonas sp.]
MPGAGAGVRRDRSGPDLFRYRLRTGPHGLRWHFLTEVLQIQEMQIRVSKVQKLAAGYTVDRDETLSLPEKEHGAG